MALVTFLRDPSHDLAIGQCEKDKNFLQLMDNDVSEIHTHCLSVRANSREKNILMKRIESNEL
jgi:hypothetical protein